MLTLWDLKKNSKAKIFGFNPIIGYEKDMLFKRLIVLGIRRGEEIKVLHSNPLRSLIEVETRLGTYSISKDAAELVFVEEIK